MPAEPDAARAKRESAEKLVLVVSDDPHVRDQVRFGFPEGVRVETAWDARDAWSKLEQSEPPSVVVVDLQTGKAGGFALAKEMGQVSRLSAIPVLILLERTQDAWLAAQSGAAAYRSKPVETSELVADAMALAARSA